MSAGNPDASWLPCTWAACMCKPCPSHVLVMPAGDLDLSIRRISAGGTEALGVAPSEILLQSPSAQCNRLLKVADLQSVSIREEGFEPAAVQVQSTGQLAQPVLLSASRGTLHCGARLTGS